MLGRLVGKSLVSHERAANRWRLLTNEALGHYLHAARLAPQYEEAVRDLRSAAAITQAIETPEQAYRLLLDSVDQARGSGDFFAVTVGLASALVTADRFPGDCRDRPDRSLREEAAATSWASFWTAPAPAANSPRP